RIIVLALATAFVLLALYLEAKFDKQLRDLLKAQMPGLASQADAFVNIFRLFLRGLVAYMVVRVLNSLIFGLFRLRKGFEAPTLVRNVFTIVVFTLLFLFIFSTVFPEVNLGALFTTSAIFGVILGLALQDTLGNFFAGISMQSD